MVRGGPAKSDCTTTWIRLRKGKMRLRGISSNVYFHLVSIPLRRKKLILLISTSVSFQQTITITISYAYLCFKIFPFPSFPSLIKSSSWGKLLEPKKTLSLKFPEEFSRRIETSYNRGSLSFHKLQWIISHHWTRVNINQSGRGGGPKA